MGSEFQTMPPATASRLARDIPPLRAPYAPPDEGIAGALLASANRSPEAEARIDARAGRRDSRSLDRRQAQGRRLGTSRSAINFASCFSVRLDAGRYSPRHS